MAILKAVNYKRSDWTAMCEAIAYCRNPAKIRTSPSVLGISKDPIKAFSVNKFLNNQEHRKRLFKTFIVSMEVEWPEHTEDRVRYEALMSQLQDAAMAFWGRQGYQTQGTVHCNTAHPHFHLVLDTCNVLTGKQYSQRPKILCDFKAHMTDVMMELGLGEGILQDKLIVNIPEEEMCAEDDLDTLVKDGYLEFDTTKADSCLEDEYSAEPSLNYATVLNLGYSEILPSHFGSPLPRQLQEMVRIVDNAKGREMCRIVDNTKGREMCRIVDV